MSFKSKNLQFEADEPAFLRRLRGEARGNIDDPDRHINPIALPKKPKRLENDEDDAPAYVLEGSDATLSKADIETLTGKKNSDDTAESKSDGEKDGEFRKTGAAASKHAQKVANVGVSSKKRKAVRVGDEGEDESKTTKTKAALKKSKKKAKTIKLSFGDDEDK
jgi:hypothetical protein